MLRSVTSCLKISLQCYHSISHDQPYRTAVSGWCSVETTDVEPVLGQILVPQHNEGHIFLRMISLRSVENGQRQKMESH